MAALLTSSVMTPADAERAAALRRMKMFATGLLAVMAVIFIVAWTLEDGRPWLGYVRAAAEAGMVGALADWFAVTALFRYPLGLKIPHTAIIPSRKDAIGSSLSEFVATNFLNEDVVREKLSRLSVAKRVGGWLSRETGAARVTQELANLTRGLANVLDDEDVGEVMASMIRRRTEATQIGPILGKVLGDVVERRDHHDLVQVIFERIHEWVTRNHDIVSGAVLRQAPSWSPKFLDTLVTDKLYKEVERFARAVRDDPEHQLRIAIDRFLADLADDLQTDPVMMGRADEIKRRIIENPQVQKLASGAWASAKSVVLEAASDPDSVLRAKLTTSLRDFGHRLSTDDELAGKIDGWISDAAGYGARRYAHEVAGIIDETVAAWDGQATSRKLELLVGRDLQFIRINGTVVGALAGLVIYTLAHNLLG